MIDKARIEALASFLVRAHREGVAMNLGPDLHVRDPEEAYRVQEAVLRELDSRPPRSWKVSPPRDGQSFGSPTPLSQARGSPARFTTATRVLGIEAEIAFRFRDTPEADASPGAIAAAVDEAFVLIELCATRFANWEEAPPLCRLADFQSHGGFVLGSGTREWHSLGADARNVEISINREAVVSGAQVHPSRDPFALAVWAVRHCAARAMPLVAGDIVTTGTWTGLTPIARADEVVVRFEGIGEARLALD